MKSWIRSAMLLATSLGACAGMTSARADEMLDDLAGRIEYAFYAADSRGLQQGWQQLDKLQVEPADRALRDSYLNYGRWKAAQLLAKDDPAQAQQYAEACTEAKAMSKEGAMLATHHALLAACYGMLETLRPVRRVLYRGDREAELNRALQAGATLPQVQLIAAWLGLQQEAADKALVLLTQALNGVGSVGSSSIGWGYAETCYLLGKLELQRGNALAARNALEQALVHAPDYRDARQLLQSLTLK